MNPSAPRHPDHPTKLLDEMKTLLELRGENPFKVRAFERASRALSQPEVPWEELGRTRTWKSLEGIGAGIASVLEEWFEVGTSSELQRLKASLPLGLLEVAQVPGVGPKKARQIVEELEIRSLAELEYACRENRLLHLKGFGEKAQKKVLEGCEFLRGTQGKVTLGHALEALETSSEWKALEKTHRMQWVGDLGRKREILESLDLLSDRRTPELEKFLQKLARTLGVSAQITLGETESWDQEFFRLTGSAEFRAAFPELPKTGETLPQFFQRFGYPALPPEAWEMSCAGGALEADPILGTEERVRGVFHFHTTRSDGRGTLEEMVSEASRLGYEYVGVSDHSKSAFYAQGLKEDALEAQWREVERVREKFPHVRVFWGIESDILSDGSLDYSQEVLKRFDFVIASIHSRLQMSSEQMTKRVLAAVKNPYTTFLGHPTGRILLGRKPMEFDFEKVLEEAEKQGVAVELNANPERLDIDWRWGPVIRRLGVQISIHPDAHSVEGLQHTKFGEWMARKALIPQKQIVNLKSSQEIESWLEARRN